jgi:Kdo2-lipid IVA lauroyltransferase/acyltransferase
MPSGRTNKFRRILKSKTVRRLRYRIEYLSLLFVAATIPKMPRRWVLAAAKSLGSIAIRFDHRGRELGLKNLKLAIEHGGLDLGGRSPEAVLLACYQNFARGFLDLFWFSRLNAESLNRWVEIENEGGIRESLRDDRGAIFLTPHYGIFEWTSLVVGFRGLRLDIVAQDFQNQALTEIVRRAREHSGHRVLSRDGAMLKMLRSVKQGGNIAMLPDLNVPPQGAASEITVFGLPSCMTSAHIEISRRCGVPMFIATCEPLDDGRAVLRVLDVVSVDPSEQAESRTASTQAIWDRFEMAIRQRPELWLWMYRHWKYSSAEIVAGAKAPVVRHVTARQSRSADAERSADAIPQRLAHAVSNRRVV